MSDSIKKYIEDQVEQAHCLGAVEEFLQRKISRQSYKYVTKEKLAIVELNNEDLALDQINKLGRAITEKGVRRWVVWLAAGQYRLLIRIKN